ncbi:MAG: agmatinase [candidate division KSB1 bacterium]|nr:agmatinase [candidate division KSB1 bacterium]
MSTSFPRISEWNAYDLEPQCRDLESARYALLPLPYERTTTFGKGTREGPAAFLEASQQVELYDVELGLSPYRAGIYGAPPLHFEDSEDIERCLRRIHDAAAELLRRGKCVVAIGGEHTVSYPLIQAHRAVYPDLQVVQLDAHADLRDQYAGSPWNHACVMRRVHDLAPHVGIGIRSASEEEILWARQEGVELFLAREVLRGEVPAASILGKIDAARPVYLTIDLDCLDPSQAPGVGTPEPGGFSWHDVLTIVEALVRQRRVVGLDVVELRPLPDSVTTQFLAAKLVYRIIGLLERKKLGT